MDLNITPQTLSKPRTRLAEIDDAMAGDRVIGGTVNQSGAFVRVRDGHWRSVMGMGGNGRYFVIGAGCMAKTDGFERLGRKTGKRTRIAAVTQQGRQDAQSAVSGG